MPLTRRGSPEAEWNCWWGRRGHWRGRRSTGIWRKTVSSRHETAAPVSYKASNGIESISKGTNGLEGRKKFFVEQIAVDKIVIIAEAKVEAFILGERHTWGASSASFTCLKTRRTCATYPGTEKRCCWWLNRRLRQRRRTESWRRAGPTGRPAARRPQAVSDIPSENGL